MQYGLSAFLQDRTLRGKLADAPFTFTDGNGIFDLDFQEQSIRKNHRKTFDRLMELGGEELLQKLLDEGKTCLMGEKGKGTSPIAGTECFYLKTNAGAPTALASIFYGIAGWAELSEDFDLNQVTCTLEEEMQEETSDMQACRWGKPLPAHQYQLFFQEEKPYFFDPERNGFIQLEIPDQGKLDLVQCEKLQAAEDHMPVGYRYRTQEDGKWGYISASFTQITPPIFDQVRVSSSEYGVLCGYRDYVFAWREGVDGYSLYLPVWGCCDEDDIWLDLKWSVQVGLARLPSGEAWCQYTEDMDTRLYRSEKSTWEGLLTEWDRDEETQTWRASWSKVEFRGKMLRRYSGGMSGEDFRPWQPVLDENAVQACIAPYPEFLIHDYAEEDHETEFGISEERTKYIISQNGYWAIVELMSTFEDQPVKVYKWLTPLAFTKICFVDEMRIDGYALVERFGEWGVFCWKTETYVVPCRYDAIQVDQSGIAPVFEVSEAGLKGKIFTNGSWKEHLHREAQA